MSNSTQSNGGVGAGAGVVVGAEVVLGVEVRVVASCACGVTLWTIIACHQKRVHPDIAGHSKTYENTSLIITEVYYIHDSCEIRLLRYLHPEYGFNSSKVMEHWAVCRHVPIWHCIYPGSLQNSIALAAESLQSSLPKATLLWAA